MTQRFHLILILNDTTKQVPESNKFHSLQKFCKDKENKIVCRLDVYKAKFLTCSFFI